MEAYNVKRNRIIVIIDTFCYWNFPYYPEPEKALCDGPNMIRLDKVEKMLKTIKAIYETVK